MTQEKSFFSGLLSYLGMIIGVLVVWLIIVGGYYNIHVRMQRAVGQEIDDGAAAEFAKNLFGIWAIFIVIATYIFKEYNWYETHSTITGLVLYGSIFYLFIGVAGAMAGRED